MLNKKAVSSTRKLIENVLPSQLINKIKFYYKTKNSDNIVLKEETKQYLKSLFKEDIRKLEELIERDLSHWYQ